MVSHLGTWAGSFPQVAPNTLARAQSTLVWEARYAHGIRATVYSRTHRPTLLL